MAICTFIIKKRDWRILEVFCPVMQHLLVRKALTAASAVGIMPQQALAGVYKCMRRHIHTLNGKKKSFKNKGLTYSFAKYEMHKSKHPN